MSGEWWNGIQIDNPANFTKNVNRRTLTSNDAKPLRDTITSARIGLSKVIPGIRDTRDRDYPLWPLIKYTRRHSGLEGDSIGSPYIPILMEMSNILLTEMPNYRTNEDFKNYNYDKLADSSIRFTSVEAAVLNLIAEPDIGIIYGNDRLILFYTKRLLKWFNEFKQNNSTITANDIVKGMKEIDVKQIITNDYKFFNKTIKDINKIISEEIIDKINILYNNMNTNTQNNYRNTNTQNNYTKQEKERKWEKMQETDSDDDTNTNNYYRNTTQRNTVNINKPAVNEIFDLEATETCPSGGLEPPKEVNSTKEYYKLALIFSQDKNTGCKNQDEVKRKFQDLNNAHDYFKNPNNSVGGKKRKSSRKVKRSKSSRRVKRRNTKRRYRK